MIFILIAVFLLVVLDRARHHKHPLQLNVYFGVPGSGKTTYAAYLAREAQRESKILRLCRRFPNHFTDWILNGKNWKRPYPVWSNVPISGTLRVNAKEDLGVNLIQDGKLIIDEAGVEFNNRDYKSFPKPAIKFFKYHRHYGVSVDVFSQSFEDMDVTLRRLAQNFYVVRRSVIPWFVTTKLIRRKVGVDQNSHQLVDAYSFGFPVLDTKWIFCPPLWRMFNSYDIEDLPEKEWSPWPSDGPVRPSILQRCKEIPHALTARLFSLRKKPDSDVARLSLFEMCGKIRDALAASWREPLLAGFFSRRKKSDPDA